MLCEARWGFHIELAKTGEGDWRGGVCVVTVAARCTARTQHAKLLMSPCLRHSTLLRLICARHLQVGIKILSNLADRRLVRGDVSIPVERLATASLDGMQVAEAIAGAYRFAYADPYRACTHNKVRD